jgi:hypothetical protein
MLATIALAAGLLTGGCADEAICRGGEYPVAAVGSTGRACVSDQEEPPAGYVRYPEGKVPKHVDDQWDKYWNTHTIDKTGTISPV